MAFNTTRVENQGILDRELDRQPGVFWMQKTKRQTWWSRFTWAFAGRHGSGNEGQMDSLLFSPSGMMLDAN
jgi:hypothetical protein